VSFGYAGAATDTGHTGSPLDASWALGHPEKVTDFGHRGIHEMTRAAKAIVRALFGNAPERSYFSGCSNGGRQALMEALRYPDDYDGILAGAPANDWTRLLASAVANSQALMLQDASYIGPAKVPAIAAAVVAACDAKDAVSDGILSDPRQCGFDPAALLCTEGDSNTCLTAPQVTALKKIYDGPRDSKGAPVFPGYSPGAEDGPGGWAPWITGQAPGKSLMFGFGVGYFANMVYEKADWDFRTFKLEPALQEAERKTAATLNATDPNLKPFMERGGKLILYHGWADAAIPPLNTLRYYEKVTSTMGAREADSVLRLYLVPGMQHCAGGPGTDWLGQDGVMLTSNPDRNVLAALERWVEAGVAPSMIVAARHPGDDPAQKPVMTRPLCPHPQVAKYNGSGDTNDAANFVCVSPGS
jgi:feruloyl esterase